jgi:hypothetical protein
VLPGLRFAELIVNQGQLRCTVSHRDPIGRVWLWQGFQREQSVEDRGLSYSHTGEQGISCALSKVKSLGQRIHLPGGVNPIAWKLRSGMRHKDSPLSVPQLWAVM